MPSAKLTFSSFRAAAILIVLCGLFVALLGRVAYLQTYGRQQTIRRADRQQHQQMVLSARPGSIYDSNGLLMAATVQTQTCYIDPKFLTDRFQEDGKSLVQMDDAIAKLAALIDKEPFELSQLISDRQSARYVRIADNLDEQTCLAIRKLKIPGVGLLPANARYYPMGSIAAHVIGTRAKDGKGLEGLELKFDKVLTGKDGFVRELKDAARRPIASLAEDYLPPQHGQHIVLTIDANIQMIAEQEIDAACRQFKAKRGEVIVMDPQTGDVLAMANWPTFNPQNLEDSTPDVRRNRCLTDPYEPGSTIKPFIAGPALAWNFTRPDEIFPVRGPTYITPYGRRVTDVHGYPQLAFWDVLVKSSNIGMSMLGERMGNKNLQRALAGMGFGKATGIELPGEDPGRLNPLSRWTRYSTESVSQGYELMVTPLQLARGFCTYANGGKLVKPHLIKGVLDPTGNLIARSQLVDPRTLPQVIDPDSAIQIRRILSDVVVRGTATGNRSKTWNIFGKTGTAHISQGKNGYNDSKYTSSFVGGAPLENPRLVVTMIIHEPDKSIAHYGGTVSAPAACRLIERTLGYLQVPASPDLPPPPPEVAKSLWNFNPKLYKSSSPVATR